MAYDLSSLKVPRLSGVPLRTMVGLMEREYTRNLLGPKLAGELGANQLKAADISHHPTFLPVHPQGKSLKPDQAKATLEFYNHPGFTPCTSQLPSCLSIARAYRDATTSPTKVAQRVIANIATSNQLDIPLNAIIASDEQDIHNQAIASEQRFTQGQPLGLLDGIPIAVKDEIDAQPYATRVGSALLGQDGQARQDATSVARLRAAGAIVIGKTNMHEIGIGVTGANVTFGHCHNPYNLRHYTGGSSSGSAAAVAAGICPVSLGADGGGSIRIPASLCGVVGLKPTWGRISEYGAFPLCNSVAHIGPLGITVDDVALAYSVIAGPDLLDTFSCHQPNVHLSQYLQADLSGIKLGIYAPWFSHATRDIVQFCQLAVEKLKALNASLHDIEIEKLNLQRIAHVVTISSEMRAAVDKVHREHTEKFALDTRLILALSKLFTGADYVKAQQIRSLTIKEFERIFQQVDVIVTPATAITAPRIRNPYRDNAESSLRVATELMRFSYSTNLAGLPSLTVPVALDSKGLPIGLQLIGKPWQEHLLLRMGRALENTISKPVGQLAFNVLQDL